LVQYTHCCDLISRTIAGVKIRFCVGRADG
jgi:hypothetical protein